MKKLLAAVAATILPFVAFGLSADTTKPLFDSQVVTSGATWTSSALDLSRVESMQVFVDNTSGTAFRDLTLTTYYDPKCLTTIEQVVLRKVAPGVAPSGATHDPGRVRGYIGPNPPGSTSSSYALFDATSVASTALDSGNVVTEDAESVGVIAVASGGTTTLAAYIVRDDGTSTPASAGGFPSAAARVNVGFGLAGTNTFASSNGSIGIGPPRRVQATTSSAGTGNTVRLTILGKGRLPGTFSHQMVLPVCAKVGLSAANGTVRAWGIGR